VGRAEKPGGFQRLYVGGSMLLGMLLADLLDQKIRAEGLLRTIYLYPMALVVHCDRHRLEVDAEPQPGPGKAHARPGLGQSFSLTGWCKATPPSTAW
jgi:hypothetical protein